MIAITQHRTLSAVPLSCPGPPTRLDRANNPTICNYKAKQAVSTTICGVVYQLVDKSKLLRAATAMGVDGVFLIDDKKTFFAAV